MACSSVITPVVNVPLHSTITSAEGARFSSALCGSLLPSAPPQLVRELLRRGMSCHGLLDGDAGAASPECDAAESITHLSPLYLRRSPLVLSLRSDNEGPEATERLLRRDEVFLVQQCRE
ncbi:unnamed protein product [Pleuronectes platessa]|uniref:Uncharacterized protein n=1 Tax=Pleuronectes platessa TaxID=8262 RepID=A0A9N7UHB5_PLEPL|nr:unnamed protein product [Pleuronectes platessa]